MLKQANSQHTPLKEPFMNRIIWIVGAIVIVLAILSFAGFR